MTAHAYTEDHMVEPPAKAKPPSPWPSPSRRGNESLNAQLGWTTVSALEETFGATGTLKRETKGEVVLVSRLRAALERLNPALPPEAITAAVDELTRVHVRRPSREGNGVDLRPRSTPLELGKRGASTFRRRVIGP